MTDHDAELAAVLAEAIVSKLFDRKRSKFDLTEWSYALTSDVLAALTAAGIRCLYVPNEKIKHGARLVQVTDEFEVDGITYAIEATP